MDKLCLSQDSYFPWNSQNTKCYIMLLDMIMPITRLFQFNIILEEKNMFEASELESEAQQMFLLFYLVSWVSDTIIVVVKYGSNEHVHSVSLSSIFLHQRSLEVAPYSWEKQRERYENVTGAMWGEVIQWNVLAGSLCESFSSWRLTYSWMQDTWGRCWWWGQHRIFCLWLKTILSTEKKRNVFETIWGKVLCL